MGIEVYYLYLIYTSCEDPVQVLVESPSEHFSELAQSTADLLFGQPACPSFLWKSLGARILTQIRCHHRKVWS